MGQDNMNDIIQLQQTPRYRQWIQFGIALGVSVWLGSCVDPDSTLGKQRAAESRVTVGPELLEYRSTPNTTLEARYSIDYQDILSFTNLDTGTSVSDSLGDISTGNEFRLPNGHIIFPSSRNSNLYYVVDPFTKTLYAREVPEGVNTANKALAIDNELLLFQYNGRRNARHFTQVTNLQAGNTPTELTIQHPRRYYSVFATNQNTILYVGPYRNDGTERYVELAHLNTAGGLIHHYGEILINNPNNPQYVALTDRQKLLVDRSLSENYETSYDETSGNIIMKNNQFVMIFRYENGIYSQPSFIFGIPRPNSNFINDITDVSVTQHYATLIGKPGNEDVNVRIYQRNPNTQQYENRIDQNWQNLFDRDKIDSLKTYELPDGSLVIYFINRYSTVDIGGDVEFIFIPNNFATDGFRRDSLYNLLGDSVPHDPVVDVTIKNNIVTFSIRARNQGAASELDSKYEYYQVPLSNFFQNPQSFSTN
jgi:hypothetical protein